MPPPHQRVSSDDDDDDDEAELRAMRQARGVGGGATSTSARVSGPPDLGACITRVTGPQRARAHEPELHNRFAQRVCYLT